LYEETGVIEGAPRDWLSVAVGGYGMEKVGEEKAGEEGAEEGGDAN